MTKQEVQEKLQEIVNKIVKNFQPEKIILFGSFAWGEPNADSDVDLFIVKETDNSRKLARKIDGSIRPRPFPIDLIVYKPESIERSIRIKDFFIKNILNKGKVLYAK